jgi:hypothetical protein
MKDAMGPVEIPGDHIALAVCSAAWVLVVGLNESTTTSDQLKRAE